METESKRIEWPDFCKGFAIFLVVLGHAIGYASSNGSGDEIFLTIDKWIYSFHMALFFFVSGFLQKLSEKKSPYTCKRVLDRTCAIVGPYVIFSIIFWTIKKMVESSVNNPMSLKDLFMIGVYPLSDLWFLYALAVFYICRVVFVKFHVNDIIVFFIATVLSVFTVVLNWNEIISHTALPRICKYFSFFYAGVLFYHVLVTQLLLKRKAVILSFFLFLLGVVGLYVQRFLSGLALGVDYVFVAYCNIIALIVIGAFVRSKIMRYLGINSLYVFLLHDYAVCAVIILMRKSAVNPYMLVTLATIAGILFSLLVVWLSSKSKFIEFFFKPHLLLKRYVER